MILQENFFRTSSNRLVSPYIKIPTEAKIREFSEDIEKLILKCV